MSGREQKAVLVRLVERRLQRGEDMLRGARDLLGEGDLHKAWDRLDSAAEQFLAWGMKQETALGIGKFLLPPRLSPACRRLFESAGRGLIKHLEDADEAPEVDPNG